MTPLPQASQFASFDSLGESSVSAIPDIALAGFGAARAGSGGEQAAVNDDRLAGDVARLG